MGLENQYYDYDQLTLFLQETNRKYPLITRLESLGISSQGRNIWLMTLTSFSSHEPKQRPGIWVDGNTHASELTGCQAALFLIQYLTEQSETKEIQALLQDVVFYVIPRLSVDGAEYVLKNKSPLRSSPEIFPGHIPKENFVIKDMDGDNEVLMMRVPDESGLFKVSPEDPRLMIQREPFDRFSNAGPFYHLYPEGEFVNFDGFHKKFINPMRYDLNRQAPAEFSPKEYGAGATPTELPEAKMLMNAIVERPNIAISLTHHTYGGYLLRPMSTHPDSDFTVNDLSIFKAMGEIGQKLTGYKTLSVYHEFRYDPKECIAGAWDDWCYLHRGIFSWTTEFWSLPAQCGIQYENATDIYLKPGNENLLKVLQWCDQNLTPGSYFKDWKKVSHPQLGAVEVGGWRTLFTWSNPPAEYLAPELKKVNEFTLCLAQMLPKILIKNMGVEKKSKDGFLVKVELQNTGFLPTSISDMAQKINVYDSPRATIQLGPQQKIIVGKPETHLPHLKGRSCRSPWSSSVMGSGCVENDNETRLEWYIEGSGQILLQINYGAGGSLQKQIALT
ncbi:MAG: hypothetical protein K1X29_09630 [Bdellovibrionales bacterium]|nr:hypothetical protein [Bdellovibrionales bacterium]